MAIRKGLWNLWHQFSANRESILLSSTIVDDITKILKAIEDIYDPVFLFELVEEFYTHIASTDDPHQVKDTGFFDDRSFLDGAYKYWLYQDNAGSFEDFLKKFFHYTHIAVYDDLFNEDHPRLDHLTVESGIFHKYFEETHDSKTDLHALFQTIITLPELNRTPVCSYSCLHHDDVQYQQYRASSKTYPEPGILNSSLKQAVLGVYYEDIVYAIGGFKPYTFTCSSSLPGGLTFINQNNVARIFGTPTVTGNFNLVFNVKEQYNKTASKTLVLQIINDLAISTSSLNDGMVGSSYTATMVATGGRTPRTWNATNLPSGLSLSSTGTISGVPITAGSSNIIFRVTDNTGYVVTQTLTMIIKAALGISSTSIKAGIISQDYEFFLNGIGGITPYTWTITRLPNGLSYQNTSGMIRGIPLVTGTFNLNVTLKDAASTQVNKSLVLNVVPGVLISTDTLPHGMQNVYYTAQVTALSGTQPFTWSATVLPPGLTIDSSTGVISGIPTIYGTFATNVTVRDVHGTIYNKIIPIYVVSANEPVQITTTSLANAIYGEYYTFTMTAKGGTLPYTWSTRDLPTGLSLNSSTGIISGMTTSISVFSVQISVRDIHGEKASKVLNLVVAYDGG
jgi:hypothetical protein